MSGTEPEPEGDAPEAQGIELAEAPEEAEGQPEQPARMELAVQIEPRGACRRHVTVTIPRADIDRYFEKTFSGLMDKALVPGFRPGRAPRKLVESRFRKDVTEQVKGDLVMDSMTQLTADNKLAVISEPEIDAVAINVPDSGPMTFEFDLEVRPEFELPEWKGLTIQRPIREIGDADVEDRLRRLLQQYGTLVPFEGPAAPGDYVSVNVAFRHQGRLVNTLTEQVLRLHPVLSLRDGKVQGFARLLEGARAGEMRSGKVRMSLDAPNPQVRGQEIDAEFAVLDVKKVELPDLTPAFLRELGEFDSAGDLRRAVRENLQRQLAYHRQQRARQQVLAALTVAADWDLPQDLLLRQTQRELERAVLELRRAGFSDPEIRARENELRQNSREATTRALKEHFILERLAEEEQIEATPEDYDDEIELIAVQSGESIRRVRAQLEKRGLMDALRNQIVERKAIDLILQHARFQDVPFEFETAETEALDASAGGGDAPAEAIPQAKHSEGAPSALPGETPRR